MRDESFRNKIDEIKESINITDIIESHTELSVTGSDYRQGKCPFHDDDTPSFTVYEDSQSYHCFGCDAHGDVISFIQNIEGKSFKEVVQELSDEAGLSDPITDDDCMEMEKDFQIKEICAQTAFFYARQVPQEALDYLTQRGLSKDTIRTHYIGYANGGLKEHLLNECGFSVELCVSVGVLKQNKGGGYTDYFYKRIIFPYLHKGVFVYFTGRRLDDSQPKYLNMPGKKFFYNEIDLHKEETNIVEGIIDCLTLLQQGYPSVSTNGCSLPYVPNGTNTINICLDSDDAGRAAAITMAQKLGERSKIVQLSDKKDPNSFFQTHVKADFDDLLSKAKDLLTVQIEEISSDTPKIDLPKSLEPILEQLKKMDEPRAEAYLNEILKPRFKLSTYDLKAYRKQLFGRSRNRKNQDSDDSLSGEKCAYFEELADLVSDEGSPAFLIKEGEKLKMVNTWTVNGEIVRPPDFKDLPWKEFPDGKTVIKHYQDNYPSNEQDFNFNLFVELSTILQHTVMLPTDDYYWLSAFWIMHTYIIEHFQFTPFLLLSGPPERGKSRFGKQLVFSSFRGLWVETLREAHIIRYADLLRASLFIDLYDFSKKVSDCQSIDVVLLRSEKGAFVTRITSPEKGFFDGVDHYEVSGPTIIGTNIPITYQPIKSRCIEINMPNSEKHFKTHVTQKAAMPIVEKLLAFRARYLGVQLPSLDYPIGRRFGEITYPLYQVMKMVFPAYEDDFLDFLKSIAPNTTTSYEYPELTKHIIRTMQKLYKHVDEKGLLPLHLITSDIQKIDRDVTPHKTASVVSDLGFKKERSSKGNTSVVVWDERLLQEWLVRLGLSVSGDPELTESSEKTEETKKTGD